MRRLSLDGLADLFQHLAGGILDTRTRAEDCLGAASKQGIVVLRRDDAAGEDDDVIGALAALYTEPHDFKTCVIDSVDWLEALIWAKVCRDNGWASIEDAGYGKGYVAALNLWRQYIDGLNALRDDKGMTVIQIAHTDIKRFDSPEHDPYDRYTIKLHARAAALVQEHSDIVLFANYRISTVKADVGFNKKVSRAVGSGERVIHTTERPAFLAKNRYGLPDTLPLDWQAFAQAMPEAIQPMLMTTPVATTA